MTRINLLPKKRSLWWKIKWRATLIGELNKNEWELEWKDFLIPIALVLTLGSFIVIIMSSDIRTVKYEQHTTNHEENKKSSGVDDLFNSGSYAKFCYENGYYDYHLGFCKRMVNGTSEVKSIEDLKIDK